MTEQEIEGWRAGQQWAFTQCHARWLRTAQRLVAVLGPRVVLDAKAAMRFVAAGHGSGRQRGEDGYPCAGDPDVVRMQRRLRIPADALQPKKGGTR